MNYGMRLKEHRELSGYSQNALAKATGISQPMISWWEAGKGTPSIDFCVRLGEFYGFSIDELILYPATTDQTAEHTPAVRATSETAAFVSDFSEIIREKNFINIAKLYKAAPKELRAVALGMIIGLMSSNGINTQAVLSY